MPFPYGFSHGFTSSPRRAVTQRRNAAACPAIRRPPDLAFVQVQAADVEAAGAAEETTNDAQNPGVGRRRPETWGYDGKMLTMLTTMTIDIYRLLLWNLLLVSW